MKTLVTANQKGGVGKTASLVHLAFYMQEIGLKVAVIDLDPQANASFSLSAHRSGVVASSFLSGGGFGVSAVDAGTLKLIEADSELVNLEKMDADKVVMSFRAALEDLDKAGFDVCLIDTAPTLGNPLVVALAAADYVMSPIKLDAYSLQGIGKMNAVITNIKKINQKLKFIGILPSLIDMRIPRQVGDLKKITDAYPSLVMPTRLVVRDSINEAAGHQIPVWQVKKTSARKAAQEMRAMAEYVCEKMEISK